MSEKIKNVLKNLESKQTIKYILSSGAGTAVDAICFTILNAFFNSVPLLWLQTFLTTGIARIISAIVNYSLNYKWVFQSDETRVKSATKYFGTAIVQYGLSYVLTTLVFILFPNVVGFGRTFLKLLVDLFLFFISYQVQRLWVFKKI